MGWLHDAGIRLWYDDGIHIGSVWRKALAEALSNASGLIFMCTRNSASSPECLKEINFALNRDIPIFVVLLDGNPLPTELELSLNDRQLLDRVKFDEQTYRAKLVMALSSITPLSAHQRNVTRVEQVVEASGRKKHAKRFVFSLIAMFIAWMGVYLYMNSLNPNATSMQSEQTARIKKYGVPSIAIMPMDILTKDTDLEYLAKASGEDLLLRLQFASFRTVTISNAPTKLSAKDIGQQYDVDYVWYRTIARKNNEYRIVKRLVETAGGVDVVSYQHSLTGNELFEIQDQMASFTHEFTIAVLDGESKRLRDVPVDGMNPWELIHKPVERYAEARANAERAYKLDPNNYGANSMLARYLREEILFQMSTDVEGDKAYALKLARRGYALAPHDEFAIQTVCAVELSFGDPALALGYAQKLSVLKSFTASEYYDVLIGNGLAEEALIHALKNPLIGPETMGDINLYLDRFADAEALYRKQLADTPDDFIVSIFLANSLGQQRKLKAGRVIIEKINKDLIEAGRSKLTIEVWETGMKLTWGDQAYLKFVEGLKKLGVE